MPLIGSLAPGVILQVPNPAWGRPGTEAKYTPKYIYSAVSECVVLHASIG